MWVRRAEAEKVFDWVCDVVKDSDSEKGRDGKQDVEGSEAC